jgi:hypothetical protein
MKLAAGCRRVIYRCHASRSSQSHQVVYVRVRLAPAQVVPQSGLSRVEHSPGIKQGPFDWEIYDLSKDPSETTDLSASRRDVITSAVSVLNKEYTRDPAFPELQINAPESGRKDSAAMPNPVSRPESAAPANP